MKVPPSLKACSLLLIVFGVLGATSNAAPQEPDPASKREFVQALITVLTPALVWCLGKIPALPRPILPFVAPIFGILLGQLFAWVDTLHLTFWDTGTAGALGVWVREMFNQWVTKQVKPLEASKTDARPVDGAVAVPAAAPTDPPQQ